MRVRWTAPAADDLEIIVNFIRRDNPSAARKLAKLVFTQIESLEIMSFRGRPGVVPGTREPIFAPFPYIAVYEMERDQVRVLRIRHAAQDWPR